MAETETRLGPCTVVHFVAQEKKRSRGIDGARSLTGQGARHRPEQEPS